MRSRRFLPQFGLALLLTLLNCCKPLQTDDAAYFRFATQIAADPLDPYGFTFPGGTHANHVLAPPVLLYWWALAIRLFGTQPFVWKLWLLPFNVLLVTSLHALYRRYCRGLEWPLVVLTVLSPAFVLNLNLMLDVPAVALSLTGVTLFLRASVRRSIGEAVLAGLVAGVAMQVKYTAFLGPAVLLLHAALCRRLSLGLLAATLAVLVFASWEGLIAARYGESHFLHSLHGQSAGLTRLRGLLLPLVGVLGSAAPFTGLLALVALGLSRRGVAGGTAVIVLGYVLLACVPEAWAVFLRDAETGRNYFTLNNLLFGLFGGLACASTTALAGRLWPRTGLRTHRARIDGFVLLWLALEIVGYFVLSPTPGVRRVLRLVVVGTLLAGRLAKRLPDREGPVRGLALGGALLGLSFSAIDVYDAQAEPLAVERAADFIRQQPGEAAVWHFVYGWGGFEFYAEQAGMRRPGLTADATPQPGDWLVLAERLFCRKELVFGPEWELVVQLPVEDALPLRTVACWRCAVEHHEGPRVLVSIYRRR